MANTPLNHTGPWTLADLKAGKVGGPKHGKKVFSCFACGGGSTMGYKLAGYEMLGCNEIDPRMAALYKKNHEPKHLFLEPIQQFKLRKELPIELYNLDVLDGSPPCSSFSMAGSREKAWGDKKKFREGQAEQVLDDLFFHYIELAKRLQPKVVVAENVKGLILGNARGYVKEIFAAFEDTGYDAQLFLLNSSRMGVPQARERTFFIARRKDLNFKKLVLAFNENTISAADSVKDITTKGKFINRETQQFTLWNKCRPGENFSKHHPKKLCFTSSRCNGLEPMPTVTSQITGHNFHWAEPRNFSHDEVKRFQSFPDDYNFLKEDAGYVCGMSVPPFMMQRIAREIYVQWLQA